MATKHKLGLVLIIITSGLLLNILLPIRVFASDAGLSSCSNNNFLGLPSWYAYLKCDSDGHPQFDSNELESASAVVLIVMAITVMLLRLGGILAVVFVIIGGIKYTTSQGNPEGLQGAKNSIINALIGLLLTISASGIVSFIARNM